MFAVRAPVTFDGERFLADGATVLVEGDRIVGVEGRRHEPPAGCPVTTYDGTPLPGLVDSHVHLIADGTPGGLERAGAWHATRAGWTAWSTSRASPTTARTPPGSFWR